MLSGTFSRQRLARLPNKRMSTEHVLPFLEALWPLWVGLFVAAMCAVIAASLMRCRKCGGWHDDPKDEERCTGIKR